VIYAYAVCEREAVQPPPEGRGIGGAVLRVAFADGVAALYSRHRKLRPEPSAATMWAHERAVEAVMRSGAVLPMRFGTTLPDEAALVASLLARRDELAARLREVRGRVEIGVRVTRAPRHGRPRSGREYLLGRAREQRAARDVHAALSELAHDSRVRPRPAELVGAYLVDRDAAEAFMAEVERVAGARREVRARCTGPWPPYSFAEDVGP
jgi:hypothetical protein